MSKSLLLAAFLLIVSQAQAVSSSFSIDYKEFVLSEEVRAVLEESVQTYCLKNSTDRLSLKDVQVEKISIDQGKNDYYYEITLDNGGPQIVVEILDFANHNPKVNNVVLNAINCFSVGDQ